MSKARGGNSRPVISSQTGPHDSLAARVTRYRETAFSRPVADHSHAAFDRLVRARDDTGLPLVLDSGCGTGDSTRRLAARHADSLVIGIDRSAHRLTRARDETPPENMLLVRADLVDLYRLMAEAGWRLARHYILYPNPWPKPAHLTRRWHASPVFPAMIALGGELELRTNWHLYAEEFAAALKLCGLPAEIGLVAAPEDALTWDTLTWDPLTPFEAKYADIGHRLWRVTSPAGGHG